MFGRKTPKRPSKTTVIHKTGWTGDSDTEGLFEENLFVALIIGVALLVFAIAGFYIGFDIDLSWFEGQNFWSTAGIIILVIFIPAIAFSTFTGRSDLLASEAIFILIGFALIYMANNWDLQSFIGAFSSGWTNFGSFEFNVSSLMTIVFIVAIVVAAVGGIISGHPIGAAVVIIICGVGIFVINSTDPSNIFREIGESFGSVGEGFLGFDVGAATSSGIVGGLVGGALAIVGVALAPWTGGLSLSLTLAGVGLGAAAGFGGSFAGWW